MGWAESGDFLTDSKIAFARSIWRIGALHEIVTECCLCRYFAAAHCDELFISETFLTSDKNAEKSSDFILPNQHKLVENLSQ